MSEQVNDNIAQEEVTVGASGQSPLFFTKRAASKVYQLISEEEDFELKLRVYIMGGGCSGFQYGFTFESSVNEDDTVVVTSIDPGYNYFKASESLSDEEIRDYAYDDAAADYAPVTLLVDSISLQYLMGADIDYREDINGAQFIIRNPNAKTTCGCGSSFSTD